VLKGLTLFKNNIGNLFIRNGLVVFQFTVSIALIICTIIVFQQLKYTQNKDLGLNKENVVVIANTKRLGSNEETFRQEITKQNGIVNASISSSIPTKNILVMVMFPNRPKRQAVDERYRAFIFYGG
jgi:putative ABC transport system permease protein